MLKDQFVKELRSHLERLHLPASEINEIIRDQEEYIRDAVLAGRNEEQVVNSLGDPKIFAAGLTADLKIQKAEQSLSLKSQTSNVFGAVLAVLALAPLNLLFVLGPFLALVAVTVTAWFMSGAVVIASVAILMAFFFKLVFFDVGVFTHLATFFFVLGWVGTGILCIYLVAMFTRMFFKWTLSYLKWNVSFVKTQL